VTLLFKNVPLASARSNRRKHEVRIADSCRAQEAELVMMSSL
jgi:hypothetical protein